MCEIIQLYNGYSKFIDDVLDDDCSCTLIKTPHKNVIVDTMTAWSKQIVIDALAKHGMRPEDINYVVCTHSHADHIGNLNLFLEAQEHIIGLTSYHKNLFRDSNISKRDYVICDGVTLTATPGHTADDVSVLVRGKINGKEAHVAVVGDLYEREEDIDNPSLWMDLGSPELKQTQAETRCRIANLVDIIIPGHGPAFHVTEESRKKLAKQLEQIKSNKL